jgi:hypothetical protein
MNRSFGDFNYRVISQVIERLNLEEGSGPYVERDHTLHAKMLNLPRSIGIEVMY